MAKDEAYRKAEKRIAKAQRSNAKELDLSGMGLTELPESLGGLAQLETLWLGGNQLTELPESLDGLAQLRELYLQGNELTELPESLGGLAQLKTLWLDNNQLTELPESLGGLAQLQRLDLDGNQLTELPESLGGLAQLQLLVLYRNQLTELPESLGGLTQLRELWLNGNQLTELPESLGGLTQLRELRLQDNQLTELPESLGGLAQLQELHLNNNQLTELPESLGGLAQLQALILHGNPELGLPPEILGPRYEDLVVGGEAGPAAPQSILDYYFRIHPPAAAVQTARPLNEAKVILVGEGDVGKTSLVYQLLYGEPAEAGRGKTRGIDIHRWDVSIKEEGIRLNVWDFGGQEIMHATHQMFMTERSVYVLVLDSRQSEDANRLNYWLKIIDSFSDGSKVIVVCNHCDEEEMDLDRKQLRAKYPHIAAFVMRVCCLKKSEGIEEVRGLIFEQVDELEHVHDKLPGEWFAVKKQLEQWREAKEDFISLEKFREICGKQGEEDEEQQDRLLNLLHALGTVLHFPKCDGQRLNVLNPDWVTKGVYDILNSDALFQKHARLDEGLLRKVLDNKAYPRKKRRFVVDMMKQFELCWQFIEVEPWRVLVPDRLGKEEPPEVGEWDDALAFQFHFPVLPGSILTRLMVRRHQLIEEELFWKHGVVLSNPIPDEDNLALVRTDRDAGILYIFVKGGMVGGRNFLHAIRTELAGIIRDIRGLEYDERVPLPGEENAPPVSYGYLCQLERDGSTGEFRFPGAKQLHSVSKLLNGVEEPHVRKERYAMSEERGSGPNFQGARIDKVVIGEDRSVRGVKGKQVQVATGDSPTLEMSVQLPEASETDMGVNLDAIREIVKALQLEAEDAQYVERQLDNAKDEVEEAEPDKGAVGKALERTTKRLKEVGKLAGAIKKLTPYGMVIGRWLGTAYSWWDGIGNW